MAVTFATGLEGRQAATDGITITTAGGGATAVYATGTKRTGAASLQFFAPSATSSSLTVGTSGNYTHFGFYIDSLPVGIDRLMFGAIAAGTINVRLTPSATLGVYLNTTLIGTSAVLSTFTWYWIGVRQVTGSGVAFLQINGSDSVTGSATVSAVSGIIGFSGTEATGATIYVDDIVVDGAGFLGPSNVGLLVPTADSAVGTGWTLGTGTAIASNSGSTAVKNTPPVGVADLTAGSDTKQIRNATANANVNYDATMTTYTVAGIASGDTVLMVQPVIATAAPVTTSSKQGTVGVVSNPAITNIALGAGGTAGAFWSGVAANTYPTGWKVSFGTLTTSPSVTLGTAPVMRVTQVTSSTRIAMVAFMGVVVAWTPAVAANPPYSSPYPQLLPQ